MGIKAEGWFIYAATDAELAAKAPARLVREEFELSPPQGKEIVAAPIYGSWEGNMMHALRRSPIDICRARGEQKAVLGNAGVVEVTDVGPEVKTVRPGQLAVIFCNGETDWFGYPRKILAYDAPGTMGCLATRMKVLEGQLVPLPPKTSHSLQQWAGFSLRYITAWSNWEMAHGTYRLAVGSDELAAINVWGWGGGVTLAELDLAKRHGCRVTMLSGSDDKLAVIAEHGIEAIDRRKFGDLAYDDQRFADDPEFAKAYRRAEDAFVSEVVERTSGRKVQIFVDMIGKPVFRATLRATAREGVITSAGWREGMQLTVIRAIECIERHQHIHTHYARFSQGWKAVAFADGCGWLPPKPKRVYSFDEIPELAAAYAEGQTEMFPIFSVSPR